jgi:hypothetical protein
MGSCNRLKLGLFCANCSSRAVTTLPERWSGSWADCVSLARMADRAGIEFMLPIGRWKGYGGDTDYQGATWETVTWACGLLARTEQLTVFGTVHAPLIPPLIAAKEFVTHRRRALRPNGTKASPRCSARRCAITRRATNSLKNGSISSSWPAHRRKLSTSMGISSS